MAERVITEQSPHSPRNVIPLNWGSSGTAWVGGGGGTNPFPTTATDPNTNNFPITYATGQAGIDGNVSIALAAGFTPSATLTCWEWNKGTKHWHRIGSNSAAYNLVFDATYTSGTFKCSESAIYLITSDVVNTGPAATDGDPNVFKFNSGEG